MILKSPSKCKSISNCFPLLDKLNPIQNGKVNSRAVDYYLNGKNVNHPRLSHPERACPGVQLVCCRGTLLISTSLRPQKDIQFENEASIGEVIFLRVLFRAEYGLEILVDVSHCNGAAFCTGASIPAQEVSLG